MTEILKVNDFFCGAGGMGLGFKNAGFQLGGAWDFDKWAVESYGNNVSPKVKQADITQMTWDEVPYADVWTFGFPCQDISVAGKQAGMVKGKTRSGLFFEVMRLLEETEKNDKSRLPSVIMAENVKGLKKYLPTLEEEYNARGYRMYATLYNSKYWGVAQNRDRYFVLGVHESISNEFIFPVEQKDYVPKLSNFLDTDVDEKYYIKDEFAEEIIKQAEKQVELKGVHACITPGRVNKRQNGRRAKAEEEMFTLTAQDQHGVIKPHLRQVGMLDMKGNESIRRVYDPQGISPTLTTMQGGHRQPKVIVPYPTTTDDVSYAITTRTHACYMQRNVEKKQATLVLENNNGWRVRKLTPRECFRLQGFPEWYKLTVSDSQAYKQAGNAVTVNVAQAIAGKIKEFLLNNK